MSSGLNGTPVTDVICDASVVLKWFHTEGEADVEPARALLATHLEGRISAAIPDLTRYEIGNVLVGALGWAADDTADQLDDLNVVCPVVTPQLDELRDAAALATQFGLTFYDAAYAAVAKGRNAALATADRLLLQAGLGETPATIVVRLGLTGTV
jgi:predicted nucleic acid-binding protein